MNKLKNMIMIVLGAISALFYVLLKSKDRKIEKQQDQIKQHQSKNEELSFINKQAHTEIDYRAINCAGWDRVTVSRLDKLTLGTKQSVTTHNSRYINNCEDS